MFLSPLICAVFFKKVTRFLKLFFTFFKNNFYTFDLLSFTNAKKTNF